MKEYCELEIGLHKREIGQYSVDFRFNLPGSEAETRQRVAPTVEFDFEALKGVSLDPSEYGRALGRSFLGNPDVKIMLAEARSSAEATEMPLRLRLFIGPSAPELHELLWETLRDPDDDSAVLTNEQLVFSRYLSSFDWRPIRLRAKADLRALVVVANPSDLSTYQLPPIDVAGELERTRSALGNMAITSLASPGTATLSSIASNLRDGYDILLLVCHGKFVKCESILYLEDDAGTAAMVKGPDLIQSLRALQTPPRLVVLQSCQSAGEGEESRSAEGSALLALGPKMAEAGIPAVLAMQGKITMQTAASFMPTFFTELRRDGQIDRAMAAARGKIMERQDWWMPVLFMRLKGGRIWYVPGFAGDAKDPTGFQKWPALLSKLRGREDPCTPILGLGLLEPLFGSTREMARNWAEKSNFPMAPHQREDLPQVAQYLEADQDRSHMLFSLEESMSKEIFRRHGDLLKDSGLSEESELDQIIDHVGGKLYDLVPGTPHKILAQLPLPIYITMTQDNLLYNALLKEGKKPRQEICRWNPQLFSLPSIFETDPDYRPDAKNPLVYHLFGRFDNKHSLVLTEDDYFDFLIGTNSLAKTQKRFPPVVGTALADSALAFFGQNMDDWSFRVLLRNILSQEGGNRRDQYAHVAVQITPEEGRILEPERAKKYLTSYFGNAHISVFWGSVEDFFDELSKRLKKE